MKSSQDMGIGPRCLHGFVTKEFLNGSDVLSVFQEMRREGTAEGVAGGMLGETPRGGCHIEDSLEK